jgi:hypothetical protein
MEVNCHKFKSFFYHIVVTKSVQQCHTQVGNYNKLKGVEKIL